MTSKGRTRRTVIALALTLGLAGAGLVTPGGAASISTLEEDPPRSPARPSGVAAGEGATAGVTIPMSYFRYCLEDVCTQDRFGYLRARSSGPTLPPQADNPRGIIDVRPGDR